MWQMLFCVIWTVRQKKRHQSCKDACRPVCWRRSRFWCSDFSKAECPGAGGVDAFSARSRKRSRNTRREAWAEGRDHTDSDVPVGKPVGIIQGSHGFIRSWGSKQHTCLSAMPYDFFWFRNLKEVDPYSSFILHSSFLLPLKFLSYWTCSIFFSSTFCSVIFIFVI